MPVQFPLSILLHFFAVEYLTLRLNTEINSLRRNKI